MKEKIREILISDGADLCGFAGIERFADAPSGFGPADIYAECKTVISFAIALPGGLEKISPRLIYGHFNSISCAEVDRIAFKSAKKIEEMYHCNAVPIPCDSPYEYWENDKLEGKGLLSMKHIAVKAGLGAMGKSQLLLNKQFGNMLTLGAILTNLELSSDDYAENLCLEGCRECIDHCPAGAISEHTVDQMKCRKNTYGKTSHGYDTVDCNMCRIVCPMTLNK